MEESLEKFCNKIKLGHIECWKLSEFYPAGEQLGLDWFTAQPLFSPDWVGQAGSQFVCKVLMKWRI